MKKKREKKDSNLLVWIAIIILTVFVIWLNLNQLEKDETPLPVEQPPRGLVIGVAENNKLVKIVEHVVNGTNLENGVCYDYANYYNRVFQRFSGCAMQSVSHAQP